ncbi:ABC transporter ATP-binding protein [Lachnospiraceae bacterium YH-ros2226]
MEPIIEFENFSFKYRSQAEPTLQDINLKIYPGEKVLIAGQSGSGKSTIAHLVNALLPCSIPGESKGKLRVCGEDPAKLGVFGMSKKVGTVLQDTDGQFIGLTVAEDLAFALENDAIKQDVLFQKVNETAEIIGMTDFLDHSPEELSGGQKQRVSMGGVLVDDVDILIFDEPLANLDPATGKNTIALIDDLMKKKDLTVLIIEHRIEDVLYRNVDRVLVMDHGRLIADQDPDSLLEQNILLNLGIREPLYISAIKHAGGELSAKDQPAHVETMNISPYAEKVRRWYQKAPIRKRENTNEFILEAQGITFAYDKKKVLNNVSFSIRKGEMLSLVGKNGAGKSTLASILCGFYKQNEGLIKLDGTDISGLTIKERGEKIGYVMQSPNQMISKPMIYDEVALGLSVRGVPQDEIKRRVYETLKICGLYPYRNWPVSALSFGQKKRVSIASILVLNPEIMILDEPTAGQDYSHYTEIMEFLKYLNEEKGLTILMITHDMHLMLEYTDRALVLCDGQLLADTYPEKVLTDHELTEKAYLKRTSLYDLAIKCGIKDPSDFVARFIEFERQNPDDVRKKAVEERRKLEEENK